MAKFGRQGCQVRKVEKSIDGSGYYSSVPRCSRCFGPPGGPAAAAAAEQVIVEQVNRRARGMGAGGWVQRTIPIRDFKSHRDYAQQNTDQ